MEISSHVLLINPKKEFLFQLRDDKQGISYPGYWSFFGGAMEEGEFPLRGLIRELKEELPDCNFEDITYLNRIENLGILTYIFKGKIKEPENYLNKKLTEGQKAKYFWIDELDTIKIVPFVRDYIYQNIDRIF